MLTKTQIKIIQVFTGSITETYSIREISRKLNMYVSLVHRNIKPLIINKILNKDKHNYLSLNYKQNHNILSYVELEKRDLFLKKHSDIALFKEEVVEKIKEDLFILILFGSTIQIKNPRDIDILLIVDNTNKVEFHENFLNNITNKYNLPFETHVIGFESVYEMLSQKDQKNLMIEILNKHIILYGAEIFYRLLKRGLK